MLLPRPSAIPDPQSIFRTSISAMHLLPRSRIMQGKQKKEQLKEKTKDTQVNVAVTQHDSIFKNIASTWWHLY